MSVFPIIDVLFVWLPQLNCDVHISLPNPFVRPLKKNTVVSSSIIPLFECQGVGVLYIGIGIIVRN